MWSLLATTPSVTLNRVDVGGATMGTQTTYFAYGYSGQNRPLIEGINTTEGTSAAGFYLDYGSFEEVFIGAAANSAEMPNSGVLTQFVGKSGGNTPSRQPLLRLWKTRACRAATWRPTRSRRRRAPPFVPTATASPATRTLNLGVGGPVLKDRMWGTSAPSSNQRNSVAAPPSGSFLDGTPFNTKLRNYTGKLTYQLNQSNKFVGYLQHGTKTQPNRTDSSNKLGAPIHITADSTTLQDSPSWVYKGEWNGTINQNTFAEFRAGQFGYNFGLDSNTGATRYESISTNQMLGGGRDWELRRRRNQFTGAVSYFKDNFAGGSHNLKVGGEYMDEKGKTLWNQAYADNVIHFVRGDLTGNAARRPRPTRCACQNNAVSINALATTSAFVTDTWTINRLTMNIGARFDRYRVWLPEQSLAAGRFSTAASFAEQSSIVTFNHIVPRFGASYDLMGDGKTVLKANWGRFYFNPGVNLADAVNANTANQYSDYVWNDLNNDRVFQQGEAGRAADALRRRRQRVHQPRPRELLHRRSVDLRRALGDARPRRARRLRVEEGQRTAGSSSTPARPFSAYNVPVTITDPGADGAVGTADDRSVSALNLDPSLLTASRQEAVNIDGYEGTYKTARVLGQQALLEPLGPERVVFVHLDQRSRQPLLQQPLRHGASPTSRSSAARRATRTRRRSTTSRTGTASSPARWTPAGA